MKSLCTTFGKYIFNDFNPKSQITGAVVLDCMQTFKSEKVFTHFFEVWRPIHTEIFLNFWIVFLGLYLNFNSLGAVKYICT